ncbi:MAG: hypothetical protein K2N06_06330 [Oscillospiraceae bacterium]|nr:hypothetical protein [Oscillospiraceae bacterium]
MIRRVKSAEDLANLPDSGILAQKIRALLLSYGTKYEFCRFFYSADFFISELSSEFVVSEIGCNPDYDELADFFGFCGFAKIFCSESVGEQLSERIYCENEIVNLMRFDGCGIPCETEHNPPLSEVYEILKSAFDIEFEPWYVDMSHRIRHGISAARRLGDSILVIQHNLNGEALLSQIVTAPQERNKGNATQLIRAVCAELSPSAVFVLCHDELTGFYTNVGFSPQGRYCQLSK